MRKRVTRDFIRPGVVSYCKMRKIEGFHNIDVMFSMPDRLLHLAFCGSDYRVSQKFLINAKPKNVKPKNVKVESAPLYSSFNASTGFSNAAWPDTHPTINIATIRITAPTAMNTNGESSTLYANVDRKLSPR